MSSLKLSSWITCLMVVFACYVVLAEKRIIDNESSRSQQQRTHLRYRRDSTSHVSERRGRSLWDDGLRISASGSKKDSKTNDRNNNNDDDDDKKTLSQQVKEGKYGLIQNEIFATEPKRPGVVSYASNSDMPKDTAKNLGGLDEDEIWLAENHVLVLRGGKLPEGENAIVKEKWPPIDDYQAPRRQVKIPPRPKVPPPFPVQLTDGGPIQILGDKDDLDSQNVLNVTFKRGFLPGEGPFFPLFANNSAPFMPLSFVPVNSTKGTLQFKPIIIPDKQLKLKPQTTKEEESPVGPFYPALPPGAVIVPPPRNRSDYDDEEDQSIYYPPPYSFVYDRKNDSSAIPPGPLVPGIILPPPPDFFSLLDDGKKTTSVKEKYKHVGSTTVVGSSLPSSIKSLRKPSTKSYTSGVTTITSSPQTTTQKAKVSTTRSSTLSRYSPKTSLRKAINNTVFVPRTVFVEVTTPTPPPIKPTTYEINAVVGNHVSETSTEKNGWTAVVTSKTVPLLATFYATTTPAPSKEQQIETTPSSGRHNSRLPDQTSYFFYGEPNNEASGSSGSNGDANVFFAPTTTESPNYYKIDEYPEEYKQEEPYYNKVEEPQRPTGIKLLESIVKDPVVYQYSESPTKDRNPGKSNANPLLVSRITADKFRNSYLTVTPVPPSTVYYQDPQVGVKFDIEQQKSKPKPIYQYSFEAADYNKERKIGKVKKQQNEREITYQYPETEIVPTIRHTPSYSEPLKVSYKSHRPIEYVTVTTNRSPVDHSTTLEPHRVYITKQDEQLLDDVTKEYFTMFGKKLLGRRVPSTTPIYKTNSVTEKPKFTSNAYVSNDYSERTHYKVPKVKVHYGGLSSIARPPFSLHGDTLINYKHPLPPINPDSEFITVISPERSRAGKLISQPIVQEDFRVRQVLQSENQVRDYGGQRILQDTQQQNQNDFIPMEGPRGIVQNPSYPRPSLANDEAVNYQNPRPPINPDAELINPREQPINRYRNKANSYFAYNLPGDGGHFYFLTPQAISQRQPNSGSYLYSNPRVSRLVRRRRGPT